EITQNFINVRKNCKLRTFETILQTNRFFYLNTDNTMPEHTAKNISVYAEASPNQESMKLVLNQTVLPDGISVDYPNVEAAANSPFAQELFNFDYVSRIFIASNFVTITKNSDDSWAQLIPELRTF